MNQDVMSKINWTYELSKFLEEEYSPEDWANYSIKEAFHEKIPNPDRESGFEEVCVVITIVNQGFDTAPHDLLNLMRRHGLNVRAISVDWEKEEVALTFFHQP